MPNFSCGNISVWKVVMNKHKLQLLQHLQILGYRHTRPDVVDNFFQMMTLSRQQLFVIDDCFETQPQTHILCCRWEKVIRSLNPIHAFALLESNNESILVCCRQVFHNFSFTTLVIQSKLSCWRQKFIEEKGIDFILPHLSTALHKVTIAKRNFHPSGLADDWG